MSSRARSRYSRSRSRSPRYTRRYSRSRSRSYSPRPGGAGRYAATGGPPGPSRRRSHSGGAKNDDGGESFSRSSRSPMSNRRRHVGSRDAPDTSNCCGVFGLSLYTTERELEKEFSKFGPLEKVTVVLDGKTGRSRGFAFVYFESMEDAKAAKDALNDQEIDGRRIRVDFSITKRPHTPTPGVYMGRPTYRGGGAGGGSGERGGSDHGDGEHGGGGGGGERGGERGGHGGHAERGGDRHGGGDHRSDRGGGGGGRGYYGGGGRGGGRGGGAGGGGYGRRSPSPYYRSRSRRDYRSRSRSYSPRRY